VDIAAAAPPPPNALKHWLPYLMHRRRCLTTAKMCELTRDLLRLRPDLTFKTDIRLQEMNFGAWEGQPWADIASRS
jgi:alpha-ribazole phosphatase